MATLKKAALIAAFVGLFVSASDAGAVSIQEARDAVVSRTLKYLNIPYLWGGQHPDTGLDCSGFVQLVYRDVGLHLPRVARDQYDATQRLKANDVEPGDLIFFAMAHPGTSRVDHVGIYMGRGYFVAASTTNGIHIEPITKDYYQQRLVGIRKYKGF